MEYVKIIQDYDGRSKVGLTKIDFSPCIHLDQSKLTLWLYRDLVFVSLLTAEMPRMLFSSWMNQCCKVPHHQPVLLLCHACV